MRKVHILFKPAGSEIIDAETNLSEIVLPQNIMVEIHYKNGGTRIKNIENLTTIELIAFAKGEECIEE